MDNILAIVCFALVAVFIITCFLRRKEKFIDRLTRHDERLFRDEKGNMIDQKTSERAEQEAIVRHIKVDDVVLELGPRYGNTSALILDIAKDAVLVEPDEMVLVALRDNLHRAGHDDVKIFHGFVGSSDKYLKQNNDRSILYDEPCDLCSRVKHIEFSDLENHFKVTFNTIVADCEGCFPEIANTTDLSNVKKILLESDMPLKGKYPEMTSALYRQGFKLLEDGFNQCWIK